MMDTAQLKKGDRIAPPADYRHVPRALPLPLVWYALQVHPNREAKVMRTFDKRNVSAYFPLINKRVTIQKSVRGTSWTYDVTRDVATPLFPGLIFIPDFECDAVDRILSVDGVVGFLRFGPWFASLVSHRTARMAGIDALSMADVRNIAAVGNTPISKRERAYETGQLVRITDGPFASFSGKIERLDSNGRLSVLINLFGRLSPTSMSEEQIEPVLSPTDAGTAREKLNKLRRIPRPS